MRQPPRFVFFAFSPGFRTPYDWSTKAAPTNQLSPSMAPLVSNAGSAFKPLVEGRGGFFSQYATLGQSQRITLRDEIANGIAKFSPDGRMIIFPFSREGVLLMSQDWLESIYRPLVEQLPDGTLVQQCKEAYMPLAVPCKLASKKRLTIGKEIFDQIPCLHGKTNILILLKEAWAELWCPDEFRAWKERLLANPLGGSPLPPPPFTPNVVRAYITACRGHK